MKLARRESQVGASAPAHWDASDGGTHRFRETLIQAARGVVVIERGHRDAASRLPPCRGVEQCGSGSSSSREGHHCDWLNEQRVSICRANERSTTAHGMPRNLRHENELLLDLRRVVLGFLNVGRFAVSLHPSHPPTILHCRSGVSHRGFRMRQSLLLFVPFVEPRLLVGRREIEYGQTLATTKNPVEVLRRLNGNSRGGSWCR